MPLRLVGLLLFMPVPQVLLHFTRPPVAPQLAVGLGVALMLTHRLYARPFALRWARQRCLWCGGATADGPELAVAEPGGTTTWRACGTAHHLRLTEFYAWLATNRLGLRIGILGSLVIFLLLTLPVGYTGVLVQHADAAAFFRLGIALTVLPVGWLAPAARGGAGPQPARVPFPVHIQALVGTVAVIWLFRLVGLLWVLQGVGQLVL
jgi:hypothetical protein